MEQIFDSRDMLSDRMPAVECSDFIFVAGMYPEFENGKHMGSLKEQLWGIDVPDLTRRNIENSAWQMDTDGMSAIGLGTWVNTIGYFRSTQASYV